MKKCISSIFLTVLLSISVMAQNIYDIDKVTNNISYEEFNKHLEFLASDKLKGRETGSEGYAKAAEYAADRFNSNGLKPFGDNNTFFQKVPFIKKSIVKSSIDINITSKNEDTINANYGENISIFINGDHERINAKQQLVFVGYGNVDTNLNINDYEGVDVINKTVLVVMGAPKKVKSYDFWDPTIKVRNAEQNGASGVIICFPQRLIQNMLFKGLHGFLGEPLLSLKDTSLVDPMFDLEFDVAAVVRKDLAKNIFKQNDLIFSKVLKKIKKGENMSQNLNSTIHCNYSIKIEDVDCQNVVALLPGSDSLLAKEHVIVGAHLDHVGVGKAIKGDSIYNGMWDNATGVATLISIAETYHDASIKPKRSLVLVCYTGEEKGLLGSNYFANRNHIPPGNMAANLNIDMLGGLFPTKDIIPMGYSHSTLSEAVDYSAKKLNFVIDDNKKEENDYLFRSDQASFLKLGVPVLNVANGYTAVDPKINGQKEINKWMKKVYHSPFDDLNQEYSKEAFHSAIKLSFLTTYYATNLLEEIKWNEDSWIYKRYVVNDAVDQ